MRLHRFYTSEPIKDIATFDLSDRDLVHQWRNVFRYNVGSQVILFDGTGIDYTCMIASLRNLGATLSVVHTQKTKKLAKEVALCVSLIKKDNFELVVQKAVELGVQTMVPIMSERSEKKNLNASRLRKIIIEATEQSGRGDLMTVLPVMTLSESFATPLPSTRIVCHPESDQVLEHMDQSVTVYIGPEGGFSPAEIALLSENNVEGVSLSPFVLRAETAAIVAVSKVL
jgi:16S rRNA (uracil1498-N3)-methyltransferase